MIDKGIRRRTLSGVRQVIVAVLFVSVYFAMPSASLTAQSSVSQVSGSVRDPLGAAIPDAAVLIRNTATNEVRTVQTDDRGEYRIPSLPVGPYQLEVKKQGFSTFIQNGIELVVNTNPDIVVTLKVGSVDQQIEITAGASMVEAHDTAITQVINGDEVVDLPLNGRQPTDLIALSGAAVNTAGAGGNVNTLDYPTAVAYSVAGSQANATNYYLDGAPNLDYRTDVGLPMPFPDALAEFSLGISSMPANLGAHPGGAVNAVTKSGTNSYHGSAFEFVRNGILDATTRTFPSVTGAIAKGVRDTLVRNQFGGTFGGPVKKDKIFFFGGYQGTLTNATVGATTTTVPTVAERNGDFTAALSAPCQVQTIKSAFVTSPGSNIIQPSLLQTPSALLAAKVLALIPSGAYDACGDYTFQGPPTITSEHQGVGRLDWQRTAKDSLFARYYFTRFVQPSQFTNGNLLSSSGVGLSDLVQTLVLGDTHIVGSHGLNTLRGTFDRTATVRTSNPGIPNLCSLGMQATCPLVNQISAYPAAGASPKPGFLGYDFENSFGGTESISWTRGRHQLDAGFTFIHVQMNNDGLFQVNPGPTWNGNITGNTVADYVTGNVDGYSQGNGQLGRDGQNQPSAYVQDNWKILSRLQITAGLRWDPFLPQHTKYGQTAAFTLAGYQAGTVSKQFINSPPGMTYPGDPGFNGKSPTNSHYAEFAPRVGFVWDITGKGTQTLRLGYGVFYDTTILWNTMHIVLNPPFGETLSFTPLTVAQGGGFANPFFGQVGGNPFPTPLTPSSTFTFPTNGAYVFENQSNKPTNVQQYNLAYQIQVGKNTKVSASYLGNKGTHIWLGRSQNSAQYLSQYGTSLPCTLQYGSQSYTFPVCNAPSQKNSTATVNGVTASNVNARRALNSINPNYGPQLAGGLITEFADGDSAYNALLVSVEQRMTHGFSVLTNYTWGRCMDDGEVGQDITNVYSNPNNPKMDWGNCTYNRKGIFNLSVLAKTPKFQEKALRYLASDWNTSAIFTASTGSNYNMLVGYDYSLTGIGLDRPNIVANPNVAGPVAANPVCTAPSTVHTIRNWYNPCAFMSQTFGTFGTERRNDMVGPANWNLNMAVWRTFSLPENVKVDFRVEGFNALNHTQISNPNATLLTTSNTSNVAAGIITSGAAPRILQLAAKVNF